MASARDQELVERFETFFRQHRSDAIADLARGYPREAKSLEIEYGDLFRFDPDFADDLLDTPKRFLDAAEEALRLYDLPVDKDLANAHVRITDLPEPTEIRDIRAEHLGTLIAVQGIIRKATSVKPKIEQAAFECLRCGTITVIPQADGNFQDPYQCDGCEREGPFQFLTDANETEFVDAQKLRIQESPEGLGGGETPESIDMHIEDDITGEVSPGDHVTATGILRLDDSDIESTDSRVFDMFLEGVDVTIEDEEFEEMEINDAEREEIIRLSEEPEIYERIVDSIAPTIYGFEVAKLAIALQLFSGVTKHLPDGARIRGDVHILLVGDPGTGKCVRGDSAVTLADGTRREIRELVESNLEDPQPIDDGVFAETDIPVLSLDEDGSIEEASATKVWKRETPERMYRVALSDGSELEITPSHPLFTLDGTSPTAVTGEELFEGTFVAVSRDQSPTPAASEAFDGTPRNTNTDVIPNVGEEVKRIRKALALTQLECGIPRTTFQHYERGDRNPGRESLRQVISTFESRLAELREAHESLDEADWETVERIRQDLAISQSELASGIGVEQTTVSMYSRGEVVPDGGRVQDARSVLRDRIEAALSEADSVRALSRLAEGDLAWAEITNIEEVDPDYDWVYDLEVEGTHSYLSNNVLSHNSQILQYIRHIAPRSVYTSGKGSSAAGLTAAAVRDDFGDGQQWSLEAGALVLADKGVAAVDELDKMACVTGDTLVSLGNGGIERIGELAHALAAEGSIEPLENGRTIRDVEGVSVKTMTEDGSIEERLVTAIHEYDAPSKLCEVTLESGESVTATSDHPFYVLEGGDQMEREASSLRPGDEVLVPENGKRIADGGTTAIKEAEPTGGRASTRGVKTVPVESVEIQPRETFDEAPRHVYDLTVEGTHNFVANGMVVHNSDDRSAMHEALEQQSYHPDTEILLADGRRVEIGEFVDEKMAARDGEIVDGIDCEILPVDDVTVHSTDMDSRKTSKVPVDRVSRHEAPDEFVRVSFSNGRSVLVTPEHPMFVAEGGDVRTVPADELERGVFVPAPRKLPNSSAAVEFEPVEQRGKERDVDLPETLSEDLAEILGLLVAEGHTYAGSAHEIGFSNQDDRLLDRMARLMTSVFGFESTDTTNKAGTVTQRWVSTKLYRWFEENVPELMEKAREKRIPSLVLGASEEHIRRFLVGAFAGDGGVESEAMAISTASWGLAKDYADALAKIGVASRIHYSKAEDSWKTYVMGDSTERFVEAIVDSADERYEKAQAFVERSNATSRHHDVLPTDAAREIRSLRTLVGLRKTGQFRPNLDEGFGVQVETVERERKAIRKRIGTVRDTLDEATDLAELRSDVGWSGRQLADRLDGETTSAIHYAEAGGYDPERRQRIVRQSRAAIKRVMDAAESRLERLGARSDFRFYRVTDVETVPNEGEFSTDWVYDVTVEPTNTFVSQGVILHNSISISKAGINATLKSRCALLGAANPELGRFDRYETPANQIDLEPALISRFDLIFTVTDQPDEEKDANLAEHILNTNYAGELNTHRTKVSTSNVSAADVENASRSVAPAIDPDIMRKYIAYARSTCFPTMTDAAESRIREFYVDLRSQGTGEDSPVPVTARKLEAIVRLAEASARVRLSDTVETEDADRALDIVEKTLKEIGMDPETGQYDADVIETGQSKSQRDRIRTIKELIAEIESEFDEGAPVEEVLARAEEIEMDRAKAEHEIEKLKTQGEVYEPTTEHLRTT